jgi:ring-1,2-phenylacetyl-CoA epoxidase subunit PaaC
MKESLYKLCIRLGDTSLILSHRLSELCSKGPYLEEDIAMTNIALDYMGQAESWLKYAAEIQGEGKNEDDLAYKRKEKDYRNFLLVEQPNIDFATVITRQFFMDAFSYNYYTELTKSSDETIAALAAKSLKEVTYHLRHSSEWVIRLGQGTEESKTRMQSAINELWIYVGEMLVDEAADIELAKGGIAVLPSSIEKAWDQTVNEIIQRAELVIPEQKSLIAGMGNGHHTENLGFILADMQFLPTNYPDAKW